MGRHAHIDLNDPEQIKGLSEEQINRIKLEQEHEGRFRWPEIKKTAFS